MIVCHCAAVDDRRIRQLVAEGAHDLLGVANASGAGSFCGGCAPVLASLVAAETGRPVAAVLQEAPTAVTAPQPARFHKRAEAVVREVLEDVAAEGWPVGRPLGSDTELAERYGVTPGTVREAVRLLSHHGLIADDRGTTVVGIPSPATIGEAAAIHLHHAGVGLDEVVEVRRTLEAIMVRRAVERADGAQRDELRGLLERPPDPRLRQTGDHVEFHLLLATLSGNPAFKLLIDALIRLARDLAPAADDRLREQLSRETARAHRSIIEAVLAGDAEGAAAAMCAHLDAFYGSVPHGAPDADVAARRRAHEDELPAAALARAIAFDIRGRGLRPGDLLGTGQQLASRYRVTRAELRQASSLLELYSVAHPHVGPRGGLIVSTPDMWGVAQLMARYLDFAGIELRHVAETRSALELRAVELASDRLDVDGARRLHQRLEEEVAARRRGTAGEGGLHNVHPLIAELAGNRVMTLFTSALILTPVQRRPAAPADVAGGHQQLTSFHAGIVEAMIEGDRHLARERMAAHLAAHLGRADSELF